MLMCGRSRQATRSFVRVRQLQHESHGGGPRAYLCSTATTILCPDLRLCKPARELARISAPSVRPSPLSEPIQPAPRADFDGRHALGSQPALDAVAVRGGSFTSARASAVGHPRPPFRGIQDAAAPQQPERVHGLHTRQRRGNSVLAVSNARLSMPCFPQPPVQPELVTPRLIAAHHAHTWMSIIRR